MADAIQKVYDEAAVVFSRSFRFVEWKFVIATEFTSTPFGDRDQPQHKATKEIDRQKWIYVFRYNHEREVYSEVWEEIRIDKGGQMAATPSGEIEKELKTRGKPVPLGKTMCLPRRVVGQPLFYRFFASRVRLPLAQIKELKTKITTFAPPVIFDPGKNLSVIVQDGELLVPVVDPVTVALHLHAAFTAAADDVINYAAAHTENPNRKLVERRRKKHLLATLLKSIIGDPDNKSANNLVSELKGDQFPLEDFLTHYEAQIQWRVERRDRFGKYLAQWLGSDAMKIAAASYMGATNSSWFQFLVPWAHSITRLAESKPGRKFLDAILDDRTHFVHTYLWPKKALPDDGIQAVRKGGMTIFEAWKEFANRNVLAKGGTVSEIIDSLEILLLPTGKKNVIKSIEQVDLYRRLLRTQGTIKSVRMIAPPPGITATDFKLDSPFSRAPVKFGAIVESVNLVFAIKSTMDAMAGEDPKKKELALIGLVGSTLDTASAVATLLRKSEKVVATLSFVSGVIDVYLADKEMRAAFKAGDQDVANATFLTAAGSTIGTAGAFMALTAIPGGQIVAVIGLLVVAIGFIYKAVAGKDPIERFFAHCSWGKEHLLAGHPDWSPTDFKDWQGDKEFDYQFEALLNIICNMEISSGNTFREFKYKMGWLPPNSKLKVKYEETWSDAADNRTIESEIQFTDKGPVSTAPTMLPFADGKNGVKITLVDFYLSKKDPHDGVYNMILKRKVNPLLRKVVASGKLISSFDGMADVVVPYNGWAKKTFY